MDAATGHPFEPKKKKKVPSRSAVPAARLRVRPENQAQHRGRPEGERGGRGPSLQSGRKVFRKKVSRNPSTSGRKRSKPAARPHADLYFNLKVGSERTPGARSKSCKQRASPLCALRLSPSPHRTHSSQQSSSKKKKNT